MLEFGQSIFYILGVGIILFNTLKIVPQQQCWIVERLGKYNRIMEAGLHIVIPFIEKIGYKHSLKERAIDISEQPAITKDNVTLLINSIIYVKITSPFNASYGVENPYYAVMQLAQTSMRSAIGKLMLDNTFEAREHLNAQIVKAINEASETWGIKCIRHEIKDINPPANILKSMETQVAAERQKRAVILESEGQMMSMINVAEGRKKEVVLNSEAIMTEQVNKAKGEAEGIQLIATATADSLSIVASAITVKGGENAVSMRVAEKYIDAFKALAQTNNSMIIPTDTGNVSSVVSQILGTYKQLKKSD